MAERVGGEGFGGETVGAVNEGDALPGLAGGVEEAAENQLAAAGGRLRNEFGELADRESAAEKLIKRRDAGGHVALGFPGFFREASGQKRPQRGERGRRGGHGGKISLDIPAYHPDQYTLRFEAFRGDVAVALIFGAQHHSTSDLN